MSPEDVKPEWVEKAARALAENEAPTVPWDDWARVSKKRWRSLARAALAAVLPEAMAEALAKYLDAYVEAQPRMGDSNAAFAVLREMAAEVNRLREGSPS
jgi:hypothetical protein